MKGSKAHGSQLDAPCTREEVTKFMAVVAYNLTAPGTAHSALQAAVTAVGWAGGVGDIYNRWSAPPPACDGTAAGTQTRIKRGRGEEGVQDKKKTPRQALSPAAGEYTSQDKPRTQYKGVSWSARDRVYTARIHHAGKFLHIGHYSDKIAAARAYDLAMLRLHLEGILDQALQFNFPDAQYTKQDIAGMHIPSLQPRFRHSNFTGVYMGNGKWKAKVRHSGTLHHLGTFQSQEDAARAYDNAVRQLQQEGVLKRPRKLNIPDDNTQSFTTVQQQHHKQQHGSSKYLGVTWVDTAGRWHAQIWHKGKMLNLGFFDVEEDAAKAYDAALLRLQVEGRLASDVLRSINFPVDSYSQEAIMTARVPSGTGRKASSRYHGVHWRKSSQRWAAGFKIGGAKIDLGLFDQEEDAAAAYDNAVMQEIAQGDLKARRKLNFQWSEGVYINHKQY